jgi:hypothetical protein
LAVDLEEAVIGEGEIVGMDGVVLLLEWAAGEGDCAVGELPQGFAGRLECAK